MTVKQVDEQRFFSMAETYDRMCRVLVPHYDLMQDEVLRLLNLERDAAITVVDLGAGSGILLEKVLTRYPQARCYWIDYSEDFGRVAESRLARFGERVAYVMSPLEEAWETSLRGQADVVLSMSAIHHLTQEEKKALYLRVYDLLLPGGWFVNVDEMKTADEDAYLESMRFWVRHVRDAEKEMSLEQLPYYGKWQAHFGRWRQRNIDQIGEPKLKGDDLHEDYASQLAWLHKAGFTYVDLFFKYHLWCAIGGRKFLTS